MKKLLVSLIFVLAVVGMSWGQALVQPVKFDQGSASFGTLAYNLDDSTETVYTVFDLSEKLSLQYYTIAVNFDQQSDDESDFQSTIVTTLQKSYDNINWSDLDTISYALTADTAFKFQDVSTGTDALLLRLKFYANSDSASAILKHVHGRFINK